MKNKPQRNVHLQASAPPQGKRLPVIGTWASERGGKVKVLFYTAIRVVREGEEEGYRVHGLRCHCLDDVI